jgi:hypothetical protein
MRTNKPRDLADAPEAPKHNHVDEPAKALFEPCTKFLNQVFHGQVSRAFPADQRLEYKYVSNAITIWMSTSRE